jgi:hypothetical protein
VSASILAGLLSVLTSIVTGLPEVTEADELTEEEAYEWLAEDEETADEVIEIEESEEEDE